MVDTSGHTSMCTCMYAPASIPTAADDTERDNAVMKKKQQTASATAAPEEPRGVVRIPLELPPDLARRLNQAMAKKFPGANRSYVLRELIEQFCKEVGVKE
ncbi:MAG: hypothetical protein JWO71_1317 [Candidatus Acidoferrum typicum]|nr:hypothetical protein [Candidatus Acidoferrum typicum]